VGVVHLGSATSRYVDQSRRTGYWAGHGRTFRYTRNPGYISATLIYVGIASLANALWVILLLPAVLLAIQRGVIEREERYLERKFGDDCQIQSVSTPLDNKADARTENPNRRRRIRGPTHFDSSLLAHHSPNRREEPLLGNPYPYGQILCVSNEVMRTGDGNLARLAWEFRSSPYGYEKLRHPAGGAP